MTTSIELKNKWNLNKRKQLANISTIADKSKYISWDAEGLKNREKLNEKLRLAVAQEFEEDILEGNVSLSSQTNKQIREFITKYVNDRDYEFEDNQLKIEFIEDFIINFSGYGILQPLMDDDAIEEIYTLGPDKIYYKRQGVTYLSPIKFQSKARMKSFLDNLLAIINRQINTMNPIEDARLPDGSRVAISGDAISPQGFTFNIRKFRKEGISLDDLIELATLNEPMKEFLIKAIQSKCSISVSGGTSSGKTTLLNALGHYIDDSEFIITLEDNIELQLNKKFWLQLETRKANLENQGEITMFDLQKHTLRRSPDRIIYGEIRDGSVANEAFNAINTGHDGCLWSIHANTPELCRKRMSKLASEHNHQPIESCIDDFNASVDLIVQIKKYEKVNRRIITQICSPDPETGKMITIFDYDPEKDNWAINPLPNRISSRFNEKLIKKRSV